MRKSNKPAVKELTIDIEILSHTFGDPWITMGADKSFVISFGYKWGHEKKAQTIDLLDTKMLHRMDAFNNNIDKKIIKRAHKVMSQADVFITHYGNKFDWKYLNAKFAKYGLPPLSHIPKFDTCLLCRKFFKLSSNRLGNVNKFFGTIQKQDIDVKHWFNIWCGNERSMKKMSEYCRFDIYSTEDLFNKHLREHCPSPYHVGVMEGKCKILSCQSCGSEKIRKRRRYATKGGTEKQSMSCKRCGKCFTITLTKLAKELLRIK